MNFIDFMRRVGLIALLGWFLFGKMMNWTTNLIGNEEIATFILLAVFAAGLYGMKRMGWIKI